MKLRESPSGAAFKGNAGDIVICLGGDSWTVGPPSGGAPSGPAGGDLGGTYPNPTVVAVEETSTPARLAFGAIADGQGVKRVGLTLVGFTIGGSTPTGPAGGDLASTYPNPTVIALEETGGPTRLTYGDIADGQGLKRVGTTCVGFAIPTSLPPSGAAGGDLGATYPNPTVLAVEETSGPTRLLFGAIADGQGLKRVGTTCVGFAIPTALPPSGTAGGDLASTYPNPTVIALEETGGPTRLTYGAIADGQGLKRVGTTCVGFAIPTSLPPSGAAGGDLGATYPNPTVLAIEETSGPTRLLFGAIADGQGLKRVGTTCVGFAIPTSLPPSGSAGGDLASTYPNPTVIAIEETGGPTRLLLGAIASGQILVRTGTTLIGASTAQPTIPNEFDNGNSGTAKTIDFTASSNAPNQKVTMTGNCAFTITPPAQQRVVQLKMIEGAGGFTRTWAVTGGTVTWVGGEPVWNSGAGKTNFANGYWDGAVLWMSGLVAS